MTSATLTLPTDAQLKAVVALNQGFIQMERRFPRWMNDDRMEDILSSAIGALNLPVNEDDLDAPSERELFWELCEERGLI